MIEWVRAGVLPAVLLGVLLGSLAGCGASDEVSLQPVTLPRQGSIRVVNAMPDASSIAAFLNSNAIAAPGFGESSPLNQSLVGRYVMNIVYTPPDDVTTTLVDNDVVNLTDPDEFSYLIIGPVASGHLLKVSNVDISYGANTTTPALFPPPDYQIVHAATGVGAADVYVTADTADLATATPSATLNFGDVTPLAKLDPAVTYRLRVTPAGSKTPVLFDSGSYGVARFIRSMYLMLDSFGPGGEPLRVAEVTATGAGDFVNQTLISTLRFENLIPGTPAVDVYMGDTTGVPLFKNAAYGVTTSYATVPNGGTTLSVTPAGDPGTVLTSGITTFVGGQARSLYASQLAATTAATSATVIESLRPITGQAQLRFVEGSPTAGTIDVYAVVPGQPISDARPVLTAAALLGSNSTNLSPGSYDVIVTRTGSTVQVFGPERISVDAGKVYSAVLLDSPGGGAPLQLQITNEVLP